MLAMPLRPLRGRVNQAATHSHHFPVLSTLVVSLAAPDNRGRCIAACDVERSDAIRFCPDLTSTPWSAPSGDAKYAALQYAVTISSLHGTMKMEK